MKHRHAHLKVKMLIFLDIDGVLHPEPRNSTEMLMSELPRLERILRDFKDVSIVISSTWRQTRTIEYFQNFFSQDIADRVIGMTPRWQDLDIATPLYQRQAEVEAWFKANCEPWNKFIVLDDKPWLFSPFYPHLLKCNPATGIDDEVESALRRLVFSSTN
jgi:hypothetical protein